MKAGRWQCQNRLGSRSAGVRCIVDWGVEASQHARRCVHGACTRVRSRVPELSTSTRSARCGAQLSQLPLAPQVELLARAPQVLGPLAAFVPIKLSALAPTADEALEPLRRVCQAAERHGLPVLLDAEQSERQAAVHRVAQRLQEEFNRQEPVVYDTLQMPRGGGFGTAATEG